LDKEIIEVPVLSDTIRSLGIPLSPVVKANGFVFVSGLPPFDLETGKLVRGDVTLQTETVMRNVQRALECAGSSLDKVVKVNLFAANSGFFMRINEAYARFFPHRPPARTFVAVASWPLEFDVEIECIALA
jgi:2-iminobutanoate/2-iminopropanoate deaminase